MKDSVDVPQLLKERIRAAIIVAGLLGNNYPDKWIGWNPRRKAHLYRRPDGIIYERTWDE